MSVWECMTARETFLAAYREAIQNGSGHECAVRIGLDAVWAAGRKYQAENPGPMPQNINEKEN